MSGARLLLAFDGPERLLQAARTLRGAGVAGMDAHTPYHLPELEPLLDERRFTLADVADAHRHLASGQAIGKIVIDIGDA